MASKEEIIAKQKLSDLTDSIKSKYQPLKLNEASFQSHQEKKFRPLLSLKKKIEDAVEVEVEKKPKIIGQDLITPILNVDDRQYGLKKANGMWFLGSFPVRFTASNIFLDDKIYPYSSGLISLLTKNNPQNYSQSDLDNYRDMLATSKFHLTLSQDNIKFRRGLKYENIIREIFPEFPSVSNSKKQKKVRLVISYIQSGTHIL